MTPLKIPLLLALCALALTFSNSHAEEKKESVTFDGQTLFLAWEGKNSGETVKEYIPAGQKLESWTKLASLREYPDLKDPKALAANVVQALKQQNPQAPSSLIENKKTGEVLIDFVTWPPNQSFVEFNIFKYSKSKNGGVTAQQYALRSYEKDNRFLETLKPLRLRLVDLMAKEGLVQKL